MSDALAAVPGVTMRGAVSSLPFTSSVGWGSINVEGWTPQPGQELQVDQRGATADYFRTMRIPLVKGRFFADARHAVDAEQVVIIDEKFAQRFWPDGDAIGKHVWFDPARKLTIVGVVGTVKQYGLDVDGRIVVYRPTPMAGYQVARTSGDPAAVAARHGAQDPRDRSDDHGVRRPDDVGPDGRTRWRASASRRSMLGAFAAFALILAVVGVYGVMSHLVTQGAHDIGVRMALGAERRSILLMVLRQGMELTVAGVVAGADRRRRADARHGQPPVRRQHDRPARRS